MLLVELFGTIRQISSITCTMKYCREEYARELGFVRHLVADLIPVMDLRI
jgi:hypothetical protein